MAAAAFGHVSVVNTLIQQGANVNYQRPDPYQDTCLMRAAKFSRLGVVDVLLRTAEKVVSTPHPTSPRADSPDGPGDTSAVRIEARDLEGRTALHLSALAGSTKAVRALLRAGADINCQCNDRGFTPLMYAIDGGYENLASYLLRQKAVNPLIESKRGDKDTARSLLDKRFADRITEDSVRQLDELLRDAEAACAAEQLAAKRLGDRPKPPSLHLLTSMNVGVGGGGPGSLDVS